MPCKSMASAGTPREPIRQKSQGPCRSDTELTPAVWETLQQQQDFYLNSSLQSQLRKSELRKEGLSKHVVFDQTNNNVRWL